MLLSFAHAESVLEEDDVANIVEFPGGDVHRYSRRFQETLEVGAEILLFTGVRYERTGTNEQIDDAVSSEVPEHSCELLPQGNIDNPKSVC